MGIFLFSFRVFREFFSKCFIPTQKPLFTSILTPTFLACFYEPLPQPSDKPTTQSANGRPASLRLIGKQQNSLLAEFRALLLPSMYEEQALLALLPGGSQPWTSTAAGESLWQGDTVQTRCQ